MNSRCTIVIASIALSVSCVSADGTSDARVDDLARLAAAPGMRIGDFDDPNLGFSRIWSVDVDRDGNIYVLEASVPEIRVYDPDGALLRRMGRRGGGPGEFQGFVRFGVIGDTIWTVDNSGESRIALFDRTGAVLSTGRTSGVAVALPEDCGLLRPWIMRSDGRFVGHFAERRYNCDVSPGVQVTDSIPVPFVLFDAAGEVLDTIGWAERPPPRMWRPPSEYSERYESVEIGGRRFYVPDPPTTAPWWLPLPDGYAELETPLAETDEDGVILVTRFGLSGETIYQRTLHYRPTRYSDADLDSIAARAARGEGGMAISVQRTGEAVAPTNWEGIAERLRDAMRFPDFTLPIENVWLAQDESVWLRRTDGESPTARWIVLDPEGRPRGELELPSDIRIVWHRGDTFWAVDPDEYDVEWLVRFAITG